MANTEAPAVKSHAPEKPQSAEGEHLTGEQLTGEQLARVVAARKARQILAASSVLSTSAADAIDVVHVANWILDGADPWPGQEFTAELGEVRVSDLAVRDVERRTLARVRDRLATASAAGWILSTIDTLTENEFPPLEDEG